MFCTSLVTANFKAWLNQAYWHFLTAQKWVEVIWEGWSLRLFCRPHRGEGECQERWQNPAFVAEALLIHRPAVFPFTSHSISLSRRFFFSSFMCRMSRLDWMACKVLCCMLQCLQSYIYNLLTSPDLRMISTESSNSIFQQSGSKSQRKGARWK